MVETHLQVFFGKNNFLSIFIQKRRFWIPVLCKVSDKVLIITGTWDHQKRLEKKLEGRKAGDISLAFKCSYKHNVVSSLL
jgi:hypothetical protein